MFSVGVNSAKVYAGGKLWQQNLLAKEEVQKFLVEKSNS